MTANKEKEISIKFKIKKIPMNKINPKCRNILGYNPIELAEKMALYIVHCPELQKFKETDRTTESIPSLNALGSHLNMPSSMIRELSNRYPIIYELAELIRTKLSSQVEKRMVNNQMAPVSGIFLLKNASTEYEDKIVEEKRDIKITVSENIISSPEQRPDKVIEIDLEK